MVLLFSLAINISNIFFSFDNQNLIFNTGSEFIFCSKNTFSIYSYDGTFKKSFFVSDELIKDLKPNSAEISFSKRFKVFNKNSDNIKIVSVGGGHVFSVDNDTLKREDFSFNHKMSFGSAVFVRNDTIFKFGGYGFWSSRNFFTYFDNSSKEWEFYPSNSLLLPPPIHNFNFKVFDDEFIMTNGYTPDVGTGIKNQSVSDIWKYNFIDRKWDNLGVSNLPKYDNILEIDNDVFFARKQNNYDFIYVDYLNNVFYDVETANTSIPINGLSSIIKGDTLYAFKDGNFLKKPYRELIYTSKRVGSIEKRIYLRSIELINGLGLSSFILVALLFSCILFLKYRQNQKPRLTQLGLRFKGTSYDMQESEKNIIEVIISKDEVMSQEIYDLVENKSLSYPQNNKIKNDNIKKINNKLEKILGIKKFIKSKKLPEDARVLVYYTEDSDLFYKKNKKTTR
jgi:hypothetical protein